LAVNFAVVLGNIVQCSKCEEVFHGNQQECPSCGKQVLTSKKAARLTDHGAVGDSRAPAALPALSVEALASIIDARFDRLETMMEKLIIHQNRAA
jgi:predicted RNA-binding Zn-ribbon protein involved in translation (DUF1610 family)